MSLDLIILVSCSFAITLLGAVIFTRNPRQGNNRRFALLSLSMVAWTAFNYLSDNSDSHTLLYTRLTFLGGLAAVYSLINFMAYFPNENVFKNNKFISVQKILTILLAPITFTPLFIASVTKNVGGGGSINTVVFYNVYLLYILYSLILLIIVILSQNKHAKTSTQKQQVSIVSWGVTLYTVLALSFNVALPLVIDDWSSSRFGPAAALLLVGVVAYTVIRHRLFDVRLVIARSLAYIVLIGGSLAVYIFLVVVLSQNIVVAENQKLINEAIPFVAALLIALTFRPVKRILDRITNKYFYHDAYDTQKLLDQLNAVLVSTIDFEQLLDKSAATMVQNIKTEFVLFDIPSHGQQYGGGTNKKLNVSLRSFDHYLDSHHANLLVADDLDTSQQQLKDSLVDNGIAIVSRLSTELNGRKHNIGYLYIGTKKSGWPYNFQDVRIIETISNELVIAIQNALRFEEIQNFNLTLQQKVDDATKKLRKTNEKLRQLDETKDDFISMASHQLRTPLTSVKGYVSMVLDGDAGKVSSQQQKLLDQAFISSQRMVYLIADLLNVSRLKTGKFVIEAKPTNLAEIVESEMDQLKETAKGRGLKLEYKQPKGFPSLNLDETKIRQVIMNFTDNAIYYTPSGGTINVNLEDKPESVELTVVDNGIGVPKNEQHHLFNKFYRAGNAKKARPDGTGLGLFMAQKVVVAQGGAIIFHSEENKGSTFGFSFPKSKLLVK